MNRIKYALLLLLLAAGPAAFAQYYHCELDVSFYLDEESGHRRYYNTMTYTTADGTSEQIHEFDMYRQSDDEELTASFDIPASRGPVTNLQTTTGRQVGTGCAFGGCATWNEDCSGSRTVVIYSGPPTVHCFNKDGWDDWGCLNSLGADYATAYKIRCYPVYTLSQSDMSGILPVNDSITINATAGFPASFYHWQYAVDFDTTIIYKPIKGWDTVVRVAAWIDFPAGLTGDQLKVSATSLLGSGVTGYINRPIFLRIRKDCGDTYDATPPLILSIRQDAPHIVSATPAPTTCFDLNNGQISIRFDRRLKFGETLNVMFSRLTGPATVVADHTEPNITIPLTYVFKSGAVLQAGTYIIDLLGTYNINGQVAPTYTGNLQRHTDTVVLTRPTAVTCSQHVSDVWCHGGDDGAIKLNAGGGVGNYQYRLFTPTDGDTSWHNFATSTSSNLSGFVAGTYYTQVRDGNKCVAKNAGGTGTIITNTAIVGQPVDSLRIDLVASQDATAYGFTNGYIQVAVYGGTAPYHYTWTNAAGTIIGSDSSAVSGGVYYAWLKRIGADTYTLLVNDHQYDSATNKIGCVQTAGFIIRQPDPLVAQLELSRLPSCNKANSESDPFHDGVLTAHVTGGTPFTPPALPYLYTWRKRDDAGSWNNLIGYSDSVATTLEAGWYAVNVQDAQGVQLGQYVSNILVQLTDSTIFLPDHALLQINEVVAPLKCNDDGSGGIISHVSGGVSPYRYYWNTGDTIADLSGVAAGGFFLFVTDSNGCRATKAIQVPEPEGYILAIDAIPPTCHDWCDGSISLNLTGGTLPYVYTWHHDASHADQALGLCGGGYTVDIADANGCSFSRMITLANPPQLHVGIPRDTTLCNGQQASFDIRIPDSAAVYQWQSDNGFVANAPQVTLDRAGNYIATVLDHNGCFAQDTFTLHRLQLDIDAEMLLPTHALAGEEIVLVNTSAPRAEIVEWQMPAQAIVLDRQDDYVRFKVNDTGVYLVTLRTGVNACREQVSRDVIVTGATDVPGSNLAASPFIEDLQVIPNPSNGHFTVTLQLRETADAAIKVVNMLNAVIVAERQLDGHSTYVESFDLIPVVAGTYLLSAETRTERRTIKLIIN